MEDDMEQRIHDLENAQASLESKLNDKDETVKTLEASNAEFKSRLNQTLADLDREKAARKIAQDGADQGTKAAEERDAAVRTVDELRRQIKQREDSYDILEKEMEKLQGKLREAERDCGDAKDEAEAKSREAASVERRASSLHRQCTELEKELDERTKALATYSGQKAQELTKAISQVAEATRRAEDQESKTAAALRANDGIQARLARTEGDLKAVSEKSAADKTGLEKQISLQETLTNLQKEKADEATKKIDSLQREIRGLQAQVARERDRTEQEKQRADTVRDKSKAVVKELQAKVLQKEAEVKKAGESAKAAAQSQSNGDPMEADAVPLDLSVDLDSLNDTELKMRLMRMERELEHARSERDRNELYLTRILREVDQKSPLLMSNKRDYQRVLQSHEQLFLKVEDSMRRCQKAEAEREAAASSRDLLEANLETAKDSLADLGAQVQKLLRDKLERDLGRPVGRSNGNGNGKAPTPKRAAGEMALVPEGNIVPVEAEQVIADHLVTFEDIREMQERNRMLVQVTRRLTAELKDSKTARSMEKTSINDRVVQELERQLDELKESRERQNEMLATVKNARDMYRLLLAQETNKDVAASNAESNGVSSGVSAAAAQEADAMKSRVHELERDVGVAREESGKLQESLRLMGDEVTTAERAQSRATAELAAVQRMLSHSEDQVKVLTEDRSARSQSIELGASKFSKLSDNVVKLQDHLERQKNDALAAQNHAKDMALTNQALRADKHIVEASERQLREENLNLRKESRHKDGLLSNLTKRDRSVSAQKDAEISTLGEELTRLRHEGEKDRRARTAAEVEREKVASSAREARQELERSVASLKAEAESAKQAAATAAASQKAAAERAVELAARLQEARARVVTSGGGGSGTPSGDSAEAPASGREDGISRQLAEVGKLQIELQATKAELKTKTEALATNERQRGQYEAMAKAKQQQLDQLNTSSKKLKEDLEAREKAAMARAEAAEAEARSTKTGLASTVADLVQEKETAEKEIRTSQQLVAKLRDDLEDSRKGAEQERGRTEDMRKELAIQQKAARAAEERYRQELEAHAGAITALRQAEDAQDEYKEAQRNAEDAKDGLAADLMRARAQWQAREALLKKAVEDSEARLTSAKSQNEVLHAHVQNLTQQLEAEQEKRQKEDRTVAARVAGQGDGGSAEAGGVEDEDNEKLRLARSVKELTELVRHKRRDEQVVTTNLELSQQRVAKLEAELDRMKLSLREAREEVQRATRNSVEAVSKTEHRKLLEEVAQMSTLRESNHMLRNNLRDAEDRSREAAGRVKELQRQVSPLRQAERRHSSASASLASEKESLRKEVENWKKRVTSLTASFNAVDPKDHEEVIAEKKKLELSLTEAKKAKDLLESNKAELIRAKGTVEKQRDDANATKTKLIAQVMELRKTAEANRKEALTQKVAATRELEAKLAAEKEKASKAVSEAHLSKQEMARARTSASNSSAGLIKQLNEQVGKAKSDGEALRIQLRQAQSARDNTGQLDEVRKEVARLKQAVEAKDRESVQSLSMYDKMKTVSRKIKENLEDTKEAVKERDGRIERLEARIVALTGESQPQSQGVAPMEDVSTAAPTASVAAGASALSGATALAAAGGVRLARPVSPVPSTSRRVSPMMVGVESQQQQHASAAAVSSATPDASGLGGRVGDGNDGGEASLRNRLMARAKRPLAATSEASGPSKRVHKPSDESSTTTAAPPTTAPGAGSVPTTGFGGTNATPSTSSSAVSPTPASSSATPSVSSSTAASVAPTTTNPAGSSGTNNNNTTTTKTADKPDITPNADAPSPSPAAASGSGTFGSTTTLNPTAQPFGFGMGGWGGGRRPAASAAPAPAPAPSAFGGMTWGAGRATPSSSTVSSSSPATAAATSTSTTAVPPTAVTPASTPAVTTTAAATTFRATATAPSAGGNDPASSGDGDENGASASTAPAPSPAPNGGGSGGALGRSALAGMKPPSSAAEFSKFPPVQLPVPSPSTEASTNPFASASATSSSSSAAASGTGTTFGTLTTTTTTTTDGTAPQEPRPTFGSTTTGGTSGAGSQIRFGLSPAATAPGGTPASFGSAVPRFGRPVPAAEATPSLAPAGVPSGAEEEKDGGDAKTGGDQAADAVDSAAAGVPGPGALKLDSHARSAAREKRFATQAAPATASSEQQEQQQQQQQQQQQEEGEIDEEDEGDAL